MTRRLVFLTAAVFAVAACSDRNKSSVADSELTRDLALANQTPATPQLNDAPLGAAPAPQRTAPPVERTPRTTKVGTARRNTPAPQPLRRETRRVEPAPAVEEPAPSPAPAPAPRTRGFATGTSFGLVTRAQVCTTNLPGDKITATLSAPVQGENGAYMPAGTVVVLEVASVTPGDKPENAQLTLRVRSIDLNEQAVSMDGDVAVLSPFERREVPRDAGADRKKVIGGAIAGAVLGQIIGKDTKSTVIGAAAGAAAGTAAAMATKKYDACLPAGASLRVTTSQPITLSN